MKVITRRDVLSDTVQIWFYDNVGSGKYVLRVRDVERGALLLERVPLGEGEPVAPTMELPAGLLEELVKAASDILPPDAGTERHLKDAILVRDRLLGVLEKQWSKPPIVVKYEAGEMPE